MSSSHSPMLAGQLKTSTKVAERSIESPHKHSNIIVNDLKSQTSKKQLQEKQQRCSGLSRKLRNVKKHNWILLAGATICMVILIVVEIAMLRTALLDFVTEKTINNLHLITQHEYSLKTHQMEIDMMDQANHAELRNTATPHLNQSQTMNAARTSLQSEINHANIDFAMIFSANGTVLLSSNSGPDFSIIKYFDPQQLVQNFSESLSDQQTLSLLTYSDLVDRRRSSTISTALEQDNALVNESDKIPVLVRLVLTKIYSVEGNTTAVLLAGDTVSSMKPNFFSDSLTTVGEGVTGLVVKSDDGVWNSVIQVTKEKEKNIYITNRSMNFSDLLLDFAWDSTNEAQILPNLTDNEKSLTVAVARIPNLNTKNALFFFAHSKTDIENMISEFVTPNITCIFIVTILNVVAIVFGCRILLHPLMEVVKCIIIENNQNYHVSVQRMRESKALYLRLLVVTIIALCALGVTLVLNVNVMQNASQIIGDMSWESRAILSSFYSKIHHTSSSIKNHSQEPLFRQLLLSNSSIDDDDLTAITNEALLNYSKIMKIDFMLLVNVNNEVKATTGSTQEIGEAVSLTNHVNYILQTSQYLAIMETMQYEEIEKYVVEDIEDEDELRDTFGSHETSLDTNKWSSNALVQLFLYPVWASIDNATENVIVGALIAANIVNEQMEYFGDITQIANGGYTAILMLNNASEDIEYITSIYQHNRYTEPQHNLQLTNTKQLFDDIKKQEPSPLIEDVFTVEGIDDDVLKIEISEISNNAAEFQSNHLWIIRGRNIAEWKITKYWLITQHIIVMIIEIMFCIFITYFTYKPLRAFLLSLDQTAVLEKKAFESNQQKTIVMQRIARNQFKRKSIERRLSRSISLADLMRSDTKQ